MPRKAISEHGRCPTTPCTRSFRPTDRRINLSPSASSSRAYPVTCPRPCWRCRSPMPGKADPSGLKRARARDRGHVLAGSSTLNRLELGEPKARETRWRYSKIVADGEALDRLLVKLFLESHAQAPGTVWLDLDATDDPLHGAQEGRFPSRGHGPGIAAVPGLPLPHARVLEPHAPGGGQGGMVEEGSQPALRGHQPAPRGCRRPIPVREVVLRARGHGEQDQGMPVGSVRRPHQYGDAARQSTTLALRRLRLRADARVAQRRSAARSGSAG